MDLYREYASNLYISFFVIIFNQLSTDLFEYNE